MTTRKENAAWQGDASESASRSTIRGKQFNINARPRLQDFLGLIGGDSAYPRCPHCGKSRLYLARRELFVEDARGGLRIVADQFGARHPKMSIDYDMRYGLGANTTICHYICADLYSHCPPFSVRISDLWGLALRRSAPDIEEHVDTIRQSILSDEIQATADSWRAIYANIR